ncbi:hypothetical protein CLF_105109 [Clonorchis sinensis]|uniref:Uncharacterized protein n=1 Tax=Clonorchis sinensis TaxID=79923 RepID=G7YCZ3_CLOSI|nr:hypothetical protein CLF_105109 [Clonorchis sinensis]
MVAGLKFVDYETRLAVLDLFPLEYRRLRGDLILTYALFEQGLADRFLTVDPANTRRGHGERQPLNDKNETDPGNLGESLDPVYQSVNPCAVSGGRSDTLSPSAQLNVFGQLHPGGLCSVEFTYQQEMAEVVAREKLLKGSHEEMVIFRMTRGVTVDHTEKERSGRP